MPYQKPPYDISMQAFLLEKIFPDMVSAPNTKVAHNRFTTQATTEAFCQTIMAAKANGFDSLLTHLAILSPRGTKDRTGQPVQHAVFVGIDFAKKTIIYQDPYGHGMDERTTNADNNQPLLRPFLQSCCPDFTLIEPKYIQQTDDCSCSLITINNMAAYSKLGEIPKHIDVDEIQKQHAQIVEIDEGNRRRKILFLIEKEVQNEITKRKELPIRRNLVNPLLKIIEDDIKTGKLANFEDVFLGKELSRKEFFVNLAVDQLAELSKQGVNKISNENKKRIAQATRKALIPNITLDFT